MEINKNAYKNMGIGKHIFLQNESPYPLGERWRPKL